MRLPLTIAACSFARLALCQPAVINAGAATPARIATASYRLSIVPSGPAPIQSSDPEYSEEGRRAGLEGTAFVQVDIAPDGTPINPSVVSGIGFGLDDKALDAVRTWRFASPAQPRSAAAVVAVNFLLPSKLSRWHLISAAFEPPEGASRPVFLPEPYPLGAGISDRAIDEGWVISAIPRSATAKLQFDVDARGRPTNFQVLAASADMWGAEAIAVVRRWRFRPGQKDGKPVGVPCTLQFVWGQKTWTPQILAKIREDLHKAAPDTSPPPNTSPEVPRGTVSAAYIIADPTPHSPYSVILSVIVDQHGVSPTVQVVRSLGSAYDSQALEAVRNWRFLNSFPVPSPVLIELDFTSGSR